MAKMHKVGKDGYAVFSYHPKNLPMGECVYAREGIRTTRSFHAKHAMAPADTTVIINKDALGKVLGYTEGEEYDTEKTRILGTDSDGRILCKPEVQASE